MYTYDHPYDYMYTIIVRRLSLGLNRIDYTTVSMSVTYPAWRDP